MARRQRYLRTCSQKHFSRKIINNSWISKEQLEEVEKRRKLRAKGTKTKIERTLYAVQNAEVRKLMRKDRQTYINEKCRHIENCLKVLYQGVKSMTRKFNPRIDTVNADDRTVLFESDEVKQRWKKYCCNHCKKNATLRGTNKQLR